MFPGPVLHILGFDVSLYILAFGLGFAPALGVMLCLGKERCVPLPLVLDVWLIAIVSCLLGAPLVSMAFGGLCHCAVPVNWGLGQLLAAFAGVGAYLMLYRPARCHMDDLANGLATGGVLYVAISRLGCFAAGCCHGRPAFGLPWAVTFTDPTSASLYIGVPVHPTQLYESGACLALLGLMLALRRRPRWRDNLVWVFVFDYAAARLVVDFYRGDVRPMVGTLTLSQAAALGMIVVAGVMLFGRMRLGWRSPCEQGNAGRVSTSRSSAG